MNRRRIGIAAACVGAAALVGRRLRTRSDAGPSIDQQTAVDSISPSSNWEPLIGSPAADVGLVETAEEALEAPDAIVQPVPTAAQVLATDITEQAAAEVIVPSVLADRASVGSPSELADMTATDATAATQSVAPQTAAAPPLSEPVADTALVQSGVETTPTQAAVRSPELSISDTPPVTPLEDAGSSAPAAIVLPTMPRAGSTEIANPVVVVPSASGGVPTEVVGPPQAIAQPVMAAAQDSAPNPTPPDMPGFDTAIPESAPPSDATAGANPSPDLVSTDRPPSGDFSSDPLVEQPPPKKRGGWRIFGSIVGGLLVVAIIAASVIRLPYYRLEPGSVYDTIERVEAPGDLVSIPQGEIGFVTVSQTANITPWQWLDAQIDGSVRIRHEDEVRGDQSADELREADLRRMQVSKNAAVVVALRKLGFDLTITPVGIEVAGIFDCTAADGTLGTGDLIIGVNGVEVRDGEALVEQLLGIGIGQDVELLIERIDPNNPTQSLRTELVGLTLGSADDDCLPDEVRAEDPRPFIGISTLTIVEEDFPIDVDVRTGRVSGPSAGLAFTLAIIDVLSEGELTNGMNIVATGTIDRDGNVGPVGGIHQKTIAAERSGADVFIVPMCCDNFVDTTTNEPVDLPSNYEEALEHADDMVIIGVNTIDEALIAIGELGGDIDQFLPLSE